MNRGLARFMRGSLQRGSMQRVDGGTPLPPIHEFGNARGSEGGNKGRGAEWEHRASHPLLGVTSYTMADALHQL